jgi:chaperone required for assembly of F1-ATPase
MTDSEGKPLPDGIKAAQTAQRSDLPKRFYTVASAAPREGGFAVLLDDRQVRTPAKKPLVVPTEPLAVALAAEWAAQVTTIDPATMPLTRIVNSALDGVTGREAEVRADIVRYAGHDLLLYRADTPLALVERQAQQWDEIVVWAERLLGGRFILAQGLMPVSQPDTTLEQVAGRLADVPALPLAGLHVITTITGSALLALALHQGHITAAEAWTAAHVDEDYQIEMWGMDDEAASRRAGRWREMQAASLLF